MRCTIACCLLCVAMLLTGCSGSSLSNVPTENPNPSYGSIDSKELATYADRYKGQYVTITGRVFHVIGDNDFQIYLGDSSYDAVYISAENKLNQIYEKTVVQIQGMVYGFYTGKNTMGQDIKQPLIMYAQVTILSQGK